MGEFAQLDNFLTQEGNKKSNLPAPVSPAWYEPESKTWYGQNDLSSLSKKEKQNLVSCTMFCQYATTGRSKCRRCGEVIEKLGLGKTSYDWDILSAGGSKIPASLCSCTLSATILPSSESRTPVFRVTCPPPLPFGWREGQHAAASKEGADATAEYSSGSVGRGGILADEMGMGKTIQAISLLLARPIKGPCLVICPMAAVNQWMKEIEKFTKKGTLKTLVYHGSEKGRVATQFKKCDVVITTYQTLESDYRREAHKHRVKCKYCGKLFMPEKLTFHQRYFCGPNAEKTKKQQRLGLEGNQPAAGPLRAGSLQSEGLIVPEVAICLNREKPCFSSSTDTPPTITNIYRDFMKQAGVDVKSKGYWNESWMLQGASSSSSKGDDGLSRERLGLLEKKDRNDGLDEGDLRKLFKGIYSLGDKFFGNELVDLCEKKGLDSSGRKPELVDRLMDFAVRGKTDEPVKKVTLAMKLLTAAKAKAKAKAKAVAKPGLKVGKAAKEPSGKRRPLLLRQGSGGSSKYQGVTKLKSGKWQANYKGKYLGCFEKVSLMQGLSGVGVALPSWQQHVSL
eukprot:g2493.t1